MKPITPDEIVDYKKIPEDIIEVFNLLIAKNYVKGNSIVKQSEVIKMLEDRKYKRSDIFEQKWLDVEPLYEKSGWDVDYDKPGYNETHDATFIFSRKDK